MEEIKVKDEMLYGYMPIVDKAILNALSQDVEEAAFSKNFESKMKELIQRESNYKSIHFLRI